MLKVGVAGKLKKWIVIPALLSLSACSGHPDIGQNGRAIGLSRSVPVSATSFVKNVNAIVKERDFSYVSITVAKPENRRVKPSPLPRTIEVTTGSGFVVDTSGHVITAGHVGISPGWWVTATGPHNKKFRGRVVAIQNIGDMALIKLENPGFLRPVKPVKNPCIAPGASIISLGKPGVQQDVARVGKLTKLHFGKKVRYQKYGYNDAMVLQLQTRRGESGGPVFDHTGAFLGMIVSTLSSAAGTPLNIAHAVATPELAKFICANTSCLPAWRHLAKKSLALCPIHVTAAKAAR